MDPTDSQDSGDIDLMSPEQFASIIRPIQSNHRSQKIKHCGELVDKRSIEDDSSNLANRRSIRRKLIQSTLVPTKDGENGDGEEEDSGEDENCGNQRKKNKQNKRSGNIKGATQPKVTKKTAVNGKDSRCKKMDDSGCSATAKSDFFVKVSEKRPRKIQKQKEQKCIDSPEGSDRICTPVDSAAEIKSPRKERKRQEKTTPVKNVYTCMKRQQSASPLKSEQASQPIPNLRLEAKMTSEENSRIFAGKQMHPFFSSWKPSKRHREITEMQSQCCSVNKMYESISFGPVHVFERIQDDFLLSPDWKNWIFGETSYNSINCDLGGVLSPLFKDSVVSLTMDNLLSALDLKEQFVQNEVFLLDQCSNAKKDLHVASPKASAEFAGGHIELCQLLKDAKKIDVMDNGLSSGHADCLNYFTAEQPSVFPQERMVTYHLSRSNQMKGSLWTNKYLPEKAIEVCGNGESVKNLSEWLHLWHERDSQANKNFKTDDNCIMEDADYVYDESESDPESINENAKLQNVLLVTGPVGSGKSAAIYACAKEQGFQVLEINTSDWRNGSHVKLKIGEALESHSLKWSLENSVGFQKKHLIKTFEDTENNEMEEIHLSDEGSEYVLGTFWGNQNDRTLLLFEDVDITSEEDRGFIAAIQQLAETAKQPMILTSNSNDPLLPGNLNRLHLSFTIPAPNELFCHVNMICMAEKFSIQPQLVKHFVECCQGDIRKIITHLQFWCQHGKGRKVRRTYHPLLFDVEAAHQIFPKLITCNFPSRLSQLVEKEISKSLYELEQNCRVMDIVEEEDPVEETHQGLDILDSESDSIETKKKAILRRNCSINDGNEQMDQFGGICEFSSSSGSPIALTRRYVRRQFVFGICSDSEDEIFNHGCLGLVDNPSANNKNELCSDINMVRLSSYFPENGNCASRSTLKLHDVGNKKEENDYGNCTSPSALKLPYVDKKEDNEYLHSGTPNGGLVPVEIPFLVNNKEQSVDVNTGDPSHFPVTQKCESPLTIFHLDGGNPSLDKNNEPVDVSKRIYSLFLETQKCSSPSTRPQLHYCGEKLEGICYLDSGPPNVCPFPQENLSMDINNEASLNDNIRPLFHFPEAQNCASSSNGHNLHYDGDTLAGNRYPCSETLTDFAISADNPSPENNNELFIDLNTKVSSHFLENQIFATPSTSFLCSDRVNLNGNCYPFSGTLNCSSVPVDNSLSGKSNELIALNIRLPETQNYKTLSTGLKLHYGGEKQVGNRYSFSSTPNDCPEPVGNQYLETNNELSVDFDTESHLLEYQNCASPSISQQLHYTEVRLKGNCYPSSGILNDWNDHYAGKSADIGEFSCVPESSFVPETEINDREEALSETMCCGNYDDMGEADSINLHIYNMDNKNSELLRKKLKMTGIGSEMKSDSYVMAAVTSGFEVMDECSRMGFNRIFKSIKNPKFRVLVDPVQETWRKLRGCEMDLRQYVTLVEKNSSQIVNVAYEISKLISEADVMLSDCQLMSRDMVEPTVIPYEESHAFCWYDRQLHMASTFAEHGFCFYAKNIGVLQSNLQIEEQGVDLTSEMLASTINTMALGKLIGQTSGASVPSYDRTNSEASWPTNSTSLKCKTMSSLQNIVQSVVPSKSYLTLKGNKTHEYLSALGQISKSEAIRLSESVKNTGRRRGRVGLHYLSKNTMLSLEDISLLSQYRYGKKSSQPSASDKTIL